MRKVSAFFLSFLFLFALCPFSVFAEGFEYTFERGEPYCESIIMLNSDTDTVVYSQNPDMQRPIASLTKIMSYIVTLETISDLNNTRIVVPQSVADELDGTGSSLAGVKVGEEFTVFELLHLMMIPSGNDAAATLANYIDSLNITVGSLNDKPKLNDDGSEISENNTDIGEEDPGRVLTFVDLMNRKAAELGCKNTHFQNAHGLHDDNHYSTARDMLTISRYAMALPHFSEITSKTYYEPPATELTPNPITLYNTNRMLQKSNAEYYYSPTTGIKTGSHDQAGFCISVSATKDYSYVAVFLGAKNKDENGNPIATHGEMLDAKELFEWAFYDLKVKTIAENGMLLGDVALNYTWKKDRLQVVAGENIQAVLPATVEASSIIPVLDLPESIDAPVKKGDYLGTATLTYADQVVGTVSVVASESVERSEMMRTLEQGKSVLTSPWFQTVLLFAAALVVIYFILMIISRKRKRKKRRNNYHKRNM